MKRILFIGHDASLTGAPKVLLHLLRWLKDNRPDLEFDLLLLSGGELEAEYARLATELFVNREAERRPVIRRGIDRLVRVARKHLRLHRPPFDRNYTLVFANTVVTLPSLELFKRRGIPTICWLHEMEFAITTFFDRDGFVRSSRNVDLFLTASRAVQMNLENFGVSTPSRVVYEVSPAVDASGVDIKLVKHELGIPGDSFVAGGGGTVEWRKGVDLFVQIASSVSNSEPKIYFIWVGGSTPNSPEHERILFDLKRYGIEDRVIFTGFTRQPERYIAAVDVFALTSREDPFPLVALEAASLRKPIVCFEKSGGMSEFVADDAGFIVPYGDVAAFAQTLIELSRDRDLVERRGAKAYEKASTTFSAENVSRVVAALIEEMIGQRD